MVMPGMISGTDPTEETTSEARSSCSEPGQWFRYAAFHPGLRHFEARQSSFLQD
jgi:hypothetical protein